MHFSAYFTAMVHWKNHSVGWQHWHVSKDCMLWIVEELGLWLFLFRSTSVANVLNDCLLCAYYVRICRHIGRWPSNHNVCTPCNIVPMLVGTHCNMSWWWYSCTNYRRSWYCPPPWMHVEYLVKQTTNFYASSYTVSTILSTIIT